MNNRGLPLIAGLVVLVAGCIPVYAPVGDIDKAEPDKSLVGKWTVAKSSGLAGLLEIKALSVTAPEVKGNPKGLMRGVMTSGGRELPMWFFTSTVDKRTYVNVIVASSGDPPVFDEEGAFAKWKKQESKQYFIFQATREGDKLTLDCGNNDAFTALMRESNIKDDSGKHFPYFYTPAGWMAKYLDKTGPDRIFDGSNILVMTREKE
jgi:hypothetical protein